MHRNVEIWSARVKHLETLRHAAVRHFEQALSGATCEQGEAIRNRRSALMHRFDEIQRRAWNAICVSNGWRKA